jgi:hypothetical protein
VREIRQHGSEGGGAELNRLSLPLFMIYDMYEDRGLTPILFNVLTFETC